jgi:regulator of replication initiation timing
MSGNVFDQLKLLREYAAALTGARDNLKDANAEITQLKGAISYLFKENQKLEHERDALRRIIDTLDADRLHDRSHTPRPALRLVPRGEQS